GDVGAASMRGGIGVDRRTHRLRRGKRYRGLLRAVKLVAVMAPAATLAQVQLPEVQVIGTTPLSASRPNPTPATTRTAPITRRTTTPAAPRAVTPIVPTVVTRPPDPSLIDRDKVPSNVLTLPASGFDTAVAPTLLDAMTRGL